MDRCRRWCLSIYTIPTDFPSKRSLAVDALPHFVLNETKMRKTRLVILPTKCLHQMGFLLLFLSCPVIGDWGRIRPESEDSHNAIQIEREGTCGMERDPPGGLLKFLDEDGSKQCRLSKDQDSNTPIKAITRSGEQRVDVRRTNTRRTIQERRLTDERRVQREVLRQMRSRSLDSIRILNGRNDARTRSLSVGMERARVFTRSTRQYDAANSRRGSERFHSTSRVNDRRSEQREQRRLSIDSRREQERASRNIYEGRENERLNRNAVERRERETTRLARSQERERQNLRRNSNRRSIQEQSRMRENDMTRRHEERNERRLSLIRRELNARGERTEDRRSFNRINVDRRMMEIRKARSLESFGRKSEERENLVRRTKDDNRRETENFRRLVTVTTKPSEQNIRERRSSLLMERELKFRRESRPVPKIEVDLKKTEDEGLFAAVTKRMDLKSYDGFNTGDWTTNCVIGAVIYFLTTRQIKSV